MGLGPSKRSRNQSRRCAKDSGISAGRSRGWSAGRAAWAVIKSLDQPGDGRGFEQAADGQLEVERSADAADEARSQKRVTAQLKEVIVKPYPRNTEGLGKERAEDLFLGRAGARQAVVASLELRRRQRFAVQLTVGVKGRASSSTIAAGTMYSGRLWPSWLRKSAGSTLWPLPPQHSPPGACRPRYLLRAITVAWATEGWLSRAASISPGSMRKPRILSCWSARPRKSSTPVGTPPGQVAGPVHARSRLSIGICHETLGA